MKPSVLVARAVFPDMIERLRAFVDVEDNPTDAVWSKQELIERLKGKQGLVALGSVQVDAELLDAVPGLKVVANVAVGYNNIDVAACTARGVLVTNTPDVLTETTADMGFALLMAAARRLAESEHYLRAGKWKQWSIDFMVGSDVFGSTLGILGMGRIGQAIARRGALGFDMKVVYHNRSRLEAGIEAELKASYVTKDELLQQADHLVLVLPYTKESHHAIGAAELAKMKPTAVLVNIARGGIVDDAALAEALAAGRIGAAGLDVFEGEPRVIPALLEVPNVVLTPHIGSATVNTRRAMTELALRNLVAGLRLGPDAGRPPTPVNPEVLAGR